jgi:hypothetical protein
VVDTPKQFSNSLLLNVATPFRFIRDIGFWCGKTTIGKWKNLRIGPSYRKGISNPASREDMANLDEEEEMGEDYTAPVNGSTTHRSKPYPSACHSSSKKAVMEARMEEEDLII